MRRAVLVGPALLILASAISWYYIIGTPQYSIYRMSAAIHARDAEEAELYIDIDRVSDEAFDMVLTAQADRKKRSAGSATWGEAMADGLIELLKPAMKARFRDELRTQLRKVSEEGPPRVGLFALPSTPLQIWRHATVNRDHRVAHVSIHDDAGRLVREFRMVQRPNRRWRIVAVESDRIREILQRKSE